MKDLVSQKFGECRPISEYENLEYETSDDDFGPDQLPDIITDAMNDLSIDSTSPLQRTELARFHGKSSSEHHKFPLSCQTCTDITYRIRFKV